MVEKPRADTVFERRVVAFEQTDDAFGRVGAKSLLLGLVAVRVAVFAGVENGIF